MIRVIIRHVGAGAAANVGGPVWIDHQTIDIDAPELEVALSRVMNDPLSHSEVVGVEVVREQAQGDAQ